MRAAAVSVLVLWLLGACAMVPQPTSIEESVGLAYANIEATATAAGQQLQAGRITVDQATEILKVLENAKAVTDTAKQALSLGRPEDASGYLTVVSAILAQIEEVLRERA